MGLTLTTLRCPDAVPPECRQASGEFTIGRGPDNDWMLADPDRHLSKRHCVVAYQSGQWQVVDLSFNGTFLNRETAPVGAAPRPLRDGDRLRFGPYEMEVSIKKDAFERLTSRPAAPDPFDDPAGDMRKTMSGAQQVEDFARELSVSAPERRREIAEALGRVAPDVRAAAAPVLVSALEDPDWHVRTAVVIALRKIARSAPGITPLLIEALGSTGEDARAAAAHALAQIGPAANNAAPALIHALADPEANVRRPAAQALGLIEPGEADITAAVAKLARVALSDPREEVRFTAGEALARLRPAAGAAVPLILRVLGHPSTRRRSDRGERMAALKLLGHLGAMTRDVMPALMLTQRDPDPFIARTASSVIAHIEAGKSNH